MLEERETLQSAVGKLSYSRKRKVCSGARNFRRTTDVTENPIPAGNLAASGVLPIVCLKIVGGFTFSAEAARTPRVAGREGLTEVAICRPQSRNRSGKKFALKIQPSSLPVRSFSSGDLETTLRTLYQLARTTAEKFRRHWQPRLST
jgi:hypothetical protein